MTPAKISLKTADLDFVGEGSEEWLGRQLEKVLAALQGPAPRSAPAGKPAKP